MVRRRLYSAASGEFALPVPLQVAEIIRLGRA
jgi:hypothetical protein